MSVGDDSYLFVKNLQGDIVKIIDEDSNVLASYSYDAWGKVYTETEDSSIEGLNPFRYRGYVYDPETELYYLQSRYYDPLTGRFINADAPEYTDTNSGSPLSTNMFAYCENDPVNFFDPNGFWLKSHHKNITSEIGIKDEFVLNWAQKADDELCRSTGYYSTPFHGRRDGLEIARQIFNLSVQIKRSRKFIPFYRKYIDNGYVPFCLKYAEKKNNDTYKRITVKAQKNFLKEISIGNPEKQSQILLGLALHTMQDYFAHCVPVFAISTTKNYYDIGGKKKIKYNNNQNKKPYVMFEINEMVNIDTKFIEDNYNLFSWRNDLAFSITRKAYSNWKKNKDINQIYVNHHNEICTYKERFWSRRRYYKNNSLYEDTFDLYYWYFEVRKLYLIFN